MLGKRELRKLQVTGGSTYTISLPKEWVADNGLKRGSQISIEEQGSGVLLVSPAELKAPQEPTEAVIKLSTNDSPESIVRKVVSAYLIGYNLISVRPKNQRLPSSYRNIIKEFTRRKFVGTEIIGDSSSEIVLKVLLSYPELSVQSALRRMSIIASSMHRDAVTALGESDVELATHVENMDDDVDRFGLYIVRQLKAAVQNSEILREIGLSSERDCLGYRLITKAVERAADHAVEIARNSPPLRDQITSEILKLIDSMSKEAISGFNEAIEAVLRKDFLLAEKVILKTEETRAFEKSLTELALNAPDAKWTSSLRLVIESIRRTAEYASDIAEIVLNMTVENVIR
jgi:phosphate uptake regulator